MGQSRVEQLRRRYMPSRIMTLFVAESAPAGGTFFYDANSNLYQYTREAFRTAFGDRVGDGEDFLNYFRRRGCYLDDLCLLPVNHMEGPDRRRCRKESVPLLARRILKHSPRAIVVIKSDIVGHVADAAEMAGLSDVPRWSLPFPAMSWQQHYVQKLSSLLPQLPCSDEWLPDQVRFGPSIPAVETDECRRVKDAGEDVAYPKENCAGEKKKGTSSRAPVTMPSWGTADCSVGC